MFNIIFYLIFAYSLTQSNTNLVECSNAVAQQADPTTLPTLLEYDSDDYSDSFLRSWPSLGSWGSWFGSLFNNKQSEDHIRSEHDHDLFQDPIFNDQMTTTFDNNNNNMQQQQRAPLEGVSTESSRASFSIDSFLDMFFQQLDQKTSDIDKQINKHFGKVNNVDQGYYDHVDIEAPAPSQSSPPLLSEHAQIVVSTTTKLPSVLSFDDYLDEDRKYFEYYSDIMDDSDSENNSTSNTATLTPSIITVVKGVKCEMLNGEQGECQQAEHCVTRDPERRAFSLCEWSVNPVTGSRQPLKLCCPKQNEWIKNNDAEGSSGPVKKFHWGFLTAYPPNIQNLINTQQQQTVFNQCGKSLYNRDHRRHATRYVYELGPRIRSDFSNQNLNSTSSNNNASSKSNSTVVYTPRIVSGVSVSSGEVPWTISIYLRDQFVCGGSMITDRHVLTAAHCFAASRVPELFYIRYGSVVLHEGPAIPVSAIMVHPGYKPPLIYHDIAVMRLSYPIRFSTQVQPVCLATNRMYGSNLVGLKSTVSGFGDSNFEGQQSDFLQAVDIKIIENQFCDQNYRRLAESKRKFRYGIGRTLICAGYEQGVKDACQGDSGGPLTIDIGGTHYQIGIVSFGFRCAQPNFPGIYTAVSHYRKWILDNIHHHQAQSSLSSIMHHQKKNVSLSSTSMEEDNENNENNDDDDEPK